MAKWKYNQNTGDIPKLHDTVKIIHTPSLNGVTGTIHGWVTNYLAIVSLDTPLKGGDKAITMPIVCLSLMGDV